MIVPFLPFPAVKSSRLPLVQLGETLNKRYTRFERRKKEAGI